MSKIYTGLYFIGFIERCGKLRSKRARVGYVAESLYGLRKFVGAVTNFDKGLSSEHD